jgi:hypothetical protein
MTAGRDPRTRKHEAGTETDAMSSPPPALAILRRVHRGAMTRSSLPGGQRYGACVVMRLLRGVMAHASRILREGPSLWQVMAPLLNLPKKSWWGDPVHSGSGRPL